MPAFSAHSRRSAARTLALCCSTALAGTLALACFLPAGVGTGAARAAEFVANDDTSFRNAIQDANADSDPTSTIRLTDDVTLDPATLPTIEHSIIIDTDGFALKARNGGAPGENGHTVTFDADPGVTLKIETAGYGGVSGGAGANGAGGAAGADGGDGGGGGDGLRISGPLSLEIANGITVQGEVGGFGGAGGAGANGGSGGSGGYGVNLGSGDLINDGSILGRTGRTGGDGVLGGNGGSGGYGVFLGIGTLTNNGSISAGTGGRGGRGTDSGGMGGTGGVGVALGSGSLLNHGTINGRTGGTGGNSGGSDGGAGGAGVTIGDGRLINNNTITGGDGGNGGDSTVDDGGGAGGAGGNGIDFSGGVGILDNYGAIRGGNGGAGGSGGAGDSGSVGFGGVGIMGSGLTIINSGTIKGGMSGDGTTQANAIEFTGGTNRLEIWNGATIIGVVDASAGTDDTLALGGLALGGNADGTFNVGTIGGTGQYRGFEAFEKTGAGTWTLTGATTAVTPWLIDTGTLSVSSEASLGDASGGLTFDGGTLRNTAAFTTARAIMLNAGGGTFQTTANLSLTGAISGSGRLSKRGAGTLTLTGDNEVGFFTVHDGKLVVDGGTLDQPDFVPGSSSNNYIGEAAGDDATLVITNGGKVSSAADWVNVGYFANSQGSVTVSGNGSILDADSILSVGDYGEGVLSVLGGGHASAGALVVGGGDFGAQGTGGFSVSGMGSSADIGDLTIGNYGNGATGVVTLSNGAMLDVQSVIRMGIGNTVGTADLNIGAASVDPADAVTPGTLHAPEMDFYHDSASLNFNHTGDGYVFDTPLTSKNAGAGFVHHYAGVTSLTGDSSGFSGNTIVHGGTLKVNGALGGAVKVESGGTLGGGGTIGGDVDVDGILSAGNSPGTLTIAGDLTLNATSTSVFELNTPGVAGGTGNDLVNVGDDLTLGGALDARVAAAGYYRLFNYDSTLTGTFDSGTLTGTGGFIPLTPNNPDIRYDIPHQVNLSVLAAGQTMQFWDGTDTTGNGTVDGGAGTWSTTGTNWTGEPGHAGINGTWGGSVGVFAGAAGGAVTVDGTQSFDTLQFKTDGYTLKGGALALTPASGTAGTLNIDNGVSAIIGSVIADGTGTGLTKTGGGTVKLAGANTYSGGTQLLGGVLWVSSNANLGDASGGLTFDGGTLRNTVAFATARDIVLGAGGGVLQTDADLRVAGTISGGGSLTKTGAGRLRLTRANSYTGGTFINQGAVTAMVTDALGTGPVSMDKAWRSPTLWVASISSTAHPREAPRSSMMEAALPSMTIRPPETPPSRPWMAPESTFMTMPRPAVPR